MTLHSIIELFKIEKTPRRGLLAVEWVVLGYMLLTSLLIMFGYTKLSDPQAMLWGRLQIVFITASLIAVYRLLPCTFTHFCRSVAQLFICEWWYTDTYALNQLFPNLDPLFAGLEQQLFGCQPALLFSQQFTSPVFSELMHLGYSSYYSLFFVVMLYYFFCHRSEFDHAVFITATSFLVFYLIFDFLPVTGPQYYYLAAGVDQIAQGVFPDVGNYFATHQEALPIPGYSDGFFYHVVQSAHAAGEHPTAAFPSSHVGMTAILLLKLWHTRDRKLFFFILPFFLLMCLATVYIQAHYAIDVLGGWVSAAIIYVVVNFFAKKFV